MQVTRVVRRFNQMTKCLTLRDWAISKYFTH